MHFIQLCIWTNLKPYRTFLINIFLDLEVENRYELLIRSSSRSNVLSFISFESQIFQTLDPSLLNENEGELLRIEGQVNLPFRFKISQKFDETETLYYRQARVLKHNNGNKFLKTINRKQQRIKQ